MKNLFAIKTIESIKITAKYLLAGSIAVFVLGVGVVSSTPKADASWGMMAVMEDIIAAVNQGDWDTVYDLIDMANEAINSGNQDFAGTQYAEPEPEPYVAPSYSYSSTSSSTYYSEEPVTPAVYSTSITVTDTGGVSPVTTQSVNNYLAQGYSPAEAASKAADDATARGYPADAVPDGSGGWIIEFSGTCNNPDILIDVDTECVSGCGGTPPGGGGGGPSPVATPAPPASGGGGGNNGGGGDDGGYDQGGYYTPPANDAPTASPIVPSTDLASVAPCTTNTRLSWTFYDPQDGGAQSGYQIQIDDNSNFSSVNYDTGGVSSGVKERYIAVGSQINFNTTYYWRVRVYDSQGAWSNFATGSSFTTPAHAAPTPSFTTSPEHPSAGEAVQFTSTSTTSGGASITGYEWNFEGGIPSSSSAQSVAVTFATEGEQAATLRVTDSDGISCSTESSLTIEQKLPDIREVPPLSAFGNFLTGFMDAFVVIADAAF